MGIFRKKGSERDSDQEPWPIERRNGYIPKGSVKPSDFPLERLPVPPPRASKPRD